MLKVKMIKSHPGEGQFPTFTKGSRVIMKDEGSHYLHWFACEIDEYQTYVPEVFVCDGTLIRDYNPTELVQNEGDILKVQEIIYSWLIATNADGVTGWIPAESVISLNCFDM